ncbi:hypothetical protein NA57DRAFT_78112 [Rhizodiscina lignyota]|uniref:Uncharacterized protein n=1 Tax=Rhizodiscina lignyota TaxID=1504668 RepID=A0A9P4I9H1_9PEZI|nr:hypothetical protein NA57DRAFT_78112 [Rhizodiscina lignyota]
MFKNRIISTQPARVMRMMQPVARSLETRPFALRFQPVRTLHMRPSERLMMRPTMRKMMPVPKEEHSAHTISQRIRTLKKIPPELIPLGVVIAAALFAAIYSMVNKLFSDKTLRLTRSSSRDHS